MQNILKVYIKMFKRIRNVPTWNFLIDNDSTIHRILLTLNYFRDVKLLSKIVMDPFILRYFPKHMSNATLLSMFKTQR